MLIITIIIINSRGRRGREWVVREGVGAGGRNNQAVYAHMNNKRKMKNNNNNNKL
jgi:hypothetical protein